jgi:hypothetical protein
MGDLSMLAAESSCSEEVGVKHRWELLERAVLFALDQGKCPANFTYPPLS